MSLDKATRQRYKALGHTLNPVVTVASKGLADGVLEEVRRALHDHELIKVKFAVGDRVVKQQIIDDLCERCDCELVQQIGHMALIYKANPTVKPHLSNARRGE
jgi:RNA-binding protein